MVVRIGLPPITPAKPISHISRSTVQRATAKHARIICTQGLVHAIRRKVVCEHAGDLGLEGQILPRPRRQACWILSPRDALVVSGWGERLDAAGRLNSIGTAVIVDKRDHRRNGRSGTVRAQYADACVKSRWPATAREPRVSAPSLCRQPQRGRRRVCRYRSRPFSPTHAVSAERSPSSRRSTPRPPTWTDDPARGRKPFVQRARTPRAQTCSSSCSSWLHLLRSWSLRQAWGGSTAQSWKRVTTQRFVGVLHPDFLALSLHLG